MVENRSKQPTLGFVRRSITRSLTEAGIDSASYEASLILQSILNLSQTEILAASELPVLPEQMQHIHSIASRRAQRQPLAYLLKQVLFAGYSFTVGTGVLIPRPDSEVLVESALQKALAIGRSLELNTADSDLIRLLDTCTGCGCIGIVIALRLIERGHRVQLHLVDLSRHALDYAWKNVTRYELESVAQCHHADLFPCVATPPFDLIVANPPYVQSAVVDQLMPEVQFEPRQALAGGADGLDVIRRLVHGAQSRLVQGGWLFMEHGYDQGEAVSDILKHEGFLDRSTLFDFGGNPRVALGRRP